MNRGDVISTVEELSLFLEGFLSEGDISCEVEEALGLLEDYPLPWVYEGCGSHAVVLGMNSGYVLRLGGSLGDSGTLGYYERILSGTLSGGLYPEVVQVRYLAEMERNPLAVVEMEKLDCLPWDACWYQLPGEGGEALAYMPDPSWGLLPYLVNSYRYDQAKEFLNWEQWKLLPEAVRDTYVLLLEALRYDGDWDLSRSNVMQRDNGELVVIDPLLW